MISNIKKHIDGLYTIDTDLDLIKLRKTADQMYDIITDRFKDDKKDYNGQSTLSTELFSKYNFLMYPLPGIHELYWTIHKSFHACLKHDTKIAYDVIKKRDTYFIQCWLNYYRKGEFINWHHHCTRNIGSWHGFLCLDTEPGSYTSYRWPKDTNRKDLILDIHSKNGMLVLGRSNNDEHRSSVWEYEDRPRITIAFDINPSWHIGDIGIQKYSEPRYLNAMKEFDHYTNHWIPI